MKTNVYIFANPDLQIDNRPIEIMPALKKIFPNVDFLVLDPFEEWQIEKNPVIIDTVVGIKQLQLFSSLDEFASTPRVTMHDYDAFTNLRLLQKLGQIESLTIIGIPPEMTIGAATQEVASTLRKLI